MKQMMSKTCYVLGGAIVVAALVSGFLAYMVVSYDPISMEYTDGLGRTLEPSPFFMRFVFDQDKKWAGWVWWAIDMVWFWGGIAAAMGFIQSGQKIEGRIDRTSG